MRLSSILGWTTTMYDPLRSIDYEIRLCRLRPYLGVGDVNITNEASGNGRRAVDLPCGRVDRHARRQRTI
jgi:hypothetical protein